MSNQNKKFFCASYSCWDCLVPLLKREHTTNLAELLKLTSVAEQSLRGSLANSSVLKLDDLPVT